MVAGPVVTWLRWATGRGRAGDEVPLRHGAENAAGGVGGHGAHVVLGREVPLQLARSSLFAFFTAFTEVSIMEPLDSGISWAVSVSVMPWPRAP